MKSRHLDPRLVRESWPVPGEQTLVQILENRAKSDPDHQICVWNGGALTIGELNEKSNRLANSLIALGFKPGEKVGVMMEQHVEHVIAMLALAKAKLTRIPITVSAKGDYLTLVLADADLSGLIVEEERRANLSESVNSTIRVVIPHDSQAASDAKGSLRHLIASGKNERPPVETTIADLVAIHGTSGTTGAPKRYGKPDIALQVGALATLIVMEAAPGDRLLLWEPLYHGAGSHIVFAALMEKITLVMVGHFSASKFWDQVRQFDVNKVHYIGGILPILMKQPESESDHAHKVTIAWGGGCPIEVWEPFEKRYGVRINEGYGLAEISNFVTANRGGPRGSVGRALPYFELRVFNDKGEDAPVGESGRIMVRGVKKEYVAIPMDKRSDKYVNGWVETGDLGYLDKDGYLFFGGRGTDSFRRRGVNISAWEVERIVLQHPSVEECALVGVSSGLGDHDLKIFVKCKPGLTVQELDLIKWCEDRMPYFQVPRYVSFVDAFPKTPTERIKKAELSKSTDDTWDLEKSGYTLRR